MRFVRPLLPRRQPKSERLPEAEPPPSGGEARAVSWQAVLDTYLPALVLALGVGIALPAIPTLARSFHVSFGLASGVLTAFLIGNTLGTVPTGWLIDRFGRRPIMLVGPVLTSAMAFLVLTAQTFPELLVLRFVDGFAAQMWLMGRLAGVSERALPHQRGRQVGWMFSMDSTGRLTGPLLGGFIAATFGIRAPFAAYGFLALLALIPAFLFVQDTRPPRARSQDGRPAERQHLSIRALVMPRLPYFCIPFFAGLARGPIQADLFHLYAAYRYHLTAQSIGFLATGASMLALPIGLLAGWMMDRFGRKKTMVPGFSGLAVGVGLLALSAFLHLSLVWYVALFLPAVAAQSLTGGSIQTLGADVAPKEGRGMFLGLWRFAGQASVSLSPVLFAVFVEKLGYGPAFVFVAMAALVVAFVLIRYVPETSGRGSVIAPTETAEPKVSSQQGNLETSR